MSQLTIPHFVQTTVVIHEVVSSHNAQVALQNGRIVFGYYPKRTPQPNLQLGQTHHAQLNVADFSRAELRGLATDA